MHTAALDDRVPHFRFSFFSTQKKHFFMHRMCHVQDFPGSWPLFDCCTAPPTHISLHFPLLQACKRIPTVLVVLAVEHVTVPIKGIMRTFAVDNFKPRTGLIPKRWVPKQVNKVHWVGKKGLFFGNDPRPRGMTEQLFFGTF